MTVLQSCAAVHLHRLTIRDFRNVAHAEVEAPRAGFVLVGDNVREGQTVMIVEAMKTMNAIPAHRAGRVSRILVENQTPVEFGQVLMLIE